MVDKLEIVFWDNNFNIPHKPLPSQKLGKYIIVDIRVEDRDTSKT